MWGMQRHLQKRSHTHESSTSIFHLLPGLRMIQSQPLYTELQPFISVIRWHLFYLLIKPSKEVNKHCRCCCLQLTSLSFVAMFCDSEVTETKMPHSRLFHSELHMDEDCCRRALCGLKHSCASAHSKYWCQSRCFVFCTLMLRLGWNICLFCSVWSHWKQRLESNVSTACYTTF